MTKTIKQNAQNQGENARRISPECAEVLHMLSSLDRKPAQAAK
jgi:hypothetical protein